jgi:hypothetical protein
MNVGTISGNTAGDGGGVYVAGGTFTMSGGAVSSNQSTSNYGGGVYVASGAFNMSGNAAVTGNQATTGGGVYVYDGSFTMSGAAAVDTANPVGLPSGEVINLSGALSADPAANIETSAVFGTQVLSGDTTIGDNYTRFLLNGASNAINSVGVILP